MERIIRLFVFLSLMFGTTTAYALDEIDFNVGLSGIVTEIEAKGEEIEGMTPQETNSKSQDLFAAYGEVFLEAQMGWVSLGISRAQDLESDTTEIVNDNSQGDSNTNKVQVDVEDITTLYLKIDFPADILGGNLFIRGGRVTADLTTNENLATGSDYPNAELEGYVAGIGYERDVADFFFRAEYNQSGYDPVSLISTTKDAEDAAFNRIKVNQLDGQSVQLSIGKSF